jgi:hypothetical protein
MYFPIQVYITTAQTRHLEKSSVYQYKPLCERKMRDGPWRGYRVGDIGKTSWGQLVYDSVILYISEDGVQCWIKPIEMHTERKSTGYGPRKHWYELSERLLSVHQVASLLQTLASLLWYRGCLIMVRLMGEALLDIRLMLNLHTLPGAAPVQSWCLALYFLGFC